jgi:hypothetical protein
MTCFTTQQLSSIISSISKMQHLYFVPCAFSTPSRTLYKQKCLLLSKLQHDDANTVDGQEQYITNEINHHAPTAGMSPYQAVVSISSGEQFVKTWPTQSRLQDAHVTMRA